MVTKVNLRKNNGSSILSVTQGDESLEHLSNVEAVTTSRQLYTGGDYVVNGTVDLTLPDDGNRFAITVQNGIVTFKGGTVNGNTDVIEQGPGRKVFAKISGDWKVLSSNSANTDFRTVTSSAQLSNNDSWIWADTSSGAITLTIPASMPTEKTFFIRRDGDNAVTVETSGTEGIVDPYTEVTNTDGVILNKNRGIIALKKTSTHYRMGVVYDPQS